MKVKNIEQTKNDTFSSTKMLQAMVGIGLICALLIVLTFEGTLERIEFNKSEALEKAIFKVIPGIVKKESYKLESGDKFSSNTGNEKDEKLIYAGYDKNENLIGIAIEASGIGFADVIKILYGYDLKAEKIIGFYVLESKETPGLGDKIEKDQGFLNNFKGLDAKLGEDSKELANKIITVKQGAKKYDWEIDGITGATISSRAIGEIFHQSCEEWLPLIQSNKEAFQLLGVETQKKEDEL